MIFYNMLQCIIPIIWVLSLVTPLRWCCATYTSSSDSCYWATWMEKCSDDRTAWAKGGTVFFKDKLSHYGDDGYHLQTVEYGDGNWMGFFKKQSGSYSWRTRTSLSDFQDVMNEMKDDGYSATALAYGDGQYMGWFRKQSGVDHWTTRDDTDDMWDKIKERFDEGYYLMSSAGGPDGNWVAWFHKDKDGDHAGYRKSSREKLHQALDDISDDGEYVTSMAHAGDGWIIYTKKKSGSSTWATRSDTQDMYDFIDDKAENDDYCATAIGYACSSTSSSSDSSDSSASK